MAYQDKEWLSMLEDWAGGFADWSLETLSNAWDGTISDQSLEALLRTMQWAFENIDGYDENIKKPTPFEAVYVFGADDGSVQATARFHDGNMVVYDTPAAQWDLKVSFKDVAAFWRFIFSGGDDILPLILNHEVEAYGNINYLHKFGFMAKDLKKRILD